MIFHFVDNDIETKWKFSSGNDQVMNNEEFPLMSCFFAVLLAEVSAVLLALGCFKKKQKDGK